MLSKVTPEALIALDQAAKLPRWTDVNRLIEAELTAILDRIIGGGNDADLHALRGRAMALREFQQLVRDAPLTLAKMGRQTPIA